MVIPDSGPRTFKDCQGRIWTIDINAWTLKRVRQATGVVLGQTVSKEGLEGLIQLCANVEQFVDVLFVLVEDQAEKLGVSDMDFGRSLKGDVIDHATIAMLGAYADFYQSQGRKALLAIINKALSYSERVRETAATKTEAMIQEIDLDKMVAMTTSGDVGNSQESLNSIPSTTLAEAPLG